MDKAKIKDLKVLPLWQPLGESTHKIAVNVSKALDRKLTHTGTLDPMAEGVIILLLDDERLKKQEHTSWLKTYEFDIIFGLTTDSYDSMGILTNFEVPTGNILELNDRIVKVLNSLIGDYSQKVPLYSAIKYAGKRLFEYGHSGASIPLEKWPVKKGRIYKLELLDTYELDFSIVVQNILDRLHLISGDFRQDPIIEQWRSILKTAPSYPPLTVVRVTTTLTRGLYVRSLSQDICAQLNIPGFVYKLTRIQNGVYTQNDCFSLEDILLN